MQGMTKDPAKYAATRRNSTITSRRYYFPAMTKFAPDDLAKLCKNRGTTCLAAILWASQNEELQTHLTKLAFDAMKGIAIKPVYHPAVRYNAMLVIGMLDDKYAIARGANQRPPKPLQGCEQVSW